jgi:GT2 family glycosyltransferase
VIYTMMPFALDYNLGRAYNESMALIGEDDWAVFLDHDAIWTTREWYRQLEEVTRAFPDVGLVTAIQSRGFQAWQVGPYDGHDYARNREIGRQMLRHRTLLDVTDNSGIAGVVMLVSKRAWRKAGGFVDGMYCVDHAFHFALKAAGLRVYVHEGLYVYHWRRANGDAPPREAPTAPNCPCQKIRRTERAPSRQLRLPR